MRATWNAQMWAAWKGDCNHPKVQQLPWNSFGECGRRRVEQAQVHRQRIPYVHIYIYIYTIKHIYIYIHTYIHVYIKPINIYCSVCINTHIYIYNTYIYIYIYKYAYICICVYLKIRFMSIYIYIYRQTYVDYSTCCQAPAPGALRGRPRDVGQERPSTRLRGPGGGSQGAFHFAHRLSPFGFWRESTGQIVLFFFLQEIATSGF